MITVQSSCTPAVTFYKGFDDENIKVGKGSKVEISSAYKLSATTINGSKRAMTLSDFEEGVDYYFIHIKNFLCRAVLKGTTLTLSDAPVIRSMKIINSSQHNITILRVDGDTTITEVVLAQSFAMRDVAAIYTRAGNLVVFGEKDDKGISQATVDGHLFVLKGSTLSVYH